MSLARRDMRGVQVSALTVMVRLLADSRAFADRWKARPLAARNSPSKPDLLFPSSVRLHADSSKSVVGEAINIVEYGPRTKTVRGRVPLGS